MDNFLRRQEAGEYKIIHNTTTSTKPVCKTGLSETRIPEDSSFLPGRFLTNFKKPSLTHYIII